MFDRVRKGGKKGREERERRNFGSEERGREKREEGERGKGDNTRKQNVDTETKKSFFFIEC